MSSSQSYSDYISDQLSDLEGVSWRAMMGEFILYYKGRIVGGIYDDRLLVKPTAAALSLLPSAKRERPYEGAKEMLLVDRIDDRAFLTELLNAMLDELPAPQEKRARRQRRSP